MAKVTRVRTLRQMLIAYTQGIAEEPIDAIRKVKNKIPIHTVIGDKTRKTYGQIKEENVDKSYDVGHVTSIAFTKATALYARASYLPGDTEYNRDLIKAGLTLLTVIDNLDYKSTNKYTQDILKELTSGGKDTHYKVLIKLANDIEGLDTINISTKVRKYSRITTHGTFNGNFEVEYEPADINRAKGRLSGAVLTALYNSIFKHSESRVAELIDNIDVTKITASPSIEDDILDHITQKFLGKRTKNISRKGKAKKSKTIRTGIGKHTRTIKKAASKKSISKGKRLRTAKGRFASTASLLPLFNELISAKVKENMWESTAPNDGVLRYQTGRFANSATIESLVQTRSSALVAQYNYMRSPYDTFAPGGRLYTVDRNPHRIIEKSIREIAVEILGNRLAVIPKLGV